MVRGRFFLFRGGVEKRVKNTRTNERKVFYFNSKKKKKQKNKKKKKETLERRREQERAMNEEGARRISLVCFQDLGLPTSYFL